MRRRARSCRAAGATWRRIGGRAEYGSTVLHELWEDPEDEGRYMFCLAGQQGNGARALLSPSARLTWTVEAESHLEAMTRYYEHQRLGRLHH